MYNFLSRKGSTVAFGLGAILTLIFVGIVFSADGLSEAPDIAAIKKDYLNVFDFGLYAAVGLTIITAILALVFGLYHMASDIKGSLIGIIGIVVIIVLFFALYSTATHETSGSIVETMQEFKITEDTSKMITGALKTTIGLGFIAILTLVGFEVRNIFK